MMSGLLKTIGIDLGTSGAKGLLVSFPDGKILGSARAPYPLYAEANRAEHDPEDWVRATLSILEQLGPADSIALDGMMHSEVCLGPGQGTERKAIDRAILWCDGRAQAQCEEIVRKLGLDTLRAIPGNRPFAGFTLPHLLWRKQLGTVLICKDYVRYRLTGDLRQEISDAPSTLCWDLTNGRWSSVVMEKLGLDPKLFPNPCGSTEIVGRWKGIPVVGGSSDNAAAAIGVGAIGEGQAMVSMGTSNVLLVSRDRPIVDPQMRVHSFPHAAPGKFYQMGCMLSGTRAFDWALKLFGLSPEEASIADSSEGLLFAPYLVGERTPHADAELRGMFAGITPDHDRSHFLRAVLEGTAFALRDAHEILGGAELRVTGGGMKNSLWRQIVADIVGVPVVTLNTSDEGAAYGAAILAAVGTGAFPNLEEACSKLVRKSSVTRPQANYDAEYARFKKLYPAARSLE